MSGKVRKKQFSFPSAEGQRMAFHPSSSPSSENVRTERSRGRGEAQDRPLPRLS